MMETLKVHLGSIEQKSGEVYEKVKKRKIRKKEKKKKRK